MSRLTLMSRLPVGTLRADATREETTERNMPKEEKRGGDTVTRCTAITNAGHRCTNDAKKPGRLCGVHLRKHRSAEKVSTSVQAAIHAEFDNETHDVTPAFVMRLCVAIMLGEVTERKMLGGEGGYIDVPPSIKDRVAAGSLWFRISEAVNTENPDWDQVREVVRHALGIHTH